MSSDPVMSSKHVTLRRWLSERARALPAQGLTDDLPLLEGRHLTSLHIPELILLLERLRGRAIDVERLQAGDFRDISTIAARFLPVDATFDTSVDAAAHATGATP